MKQIEIESFLPAHPLIKQHVIYYYILNPREQVLDNFYFAFPNINIPFIFFRDTEVSAKPEGHVLKSINDGSRYCGILTRFVKPLPVTLKGKIKTINIIFGATGFNHFIKDTYSNIITSSFQKMSCWNMDPAFIDRLFYLTHKELVHVLDDLLLTHYVPFQNEYLTHSLQLLNDDKKLTAVKDLERIVGINRKTLLRLFKTHLGLPPTAFRRIMRFRQALEKMKSGDHTLTNLAYEANFNDQSHLIKELRKLTGDKPGSFLEEATYLNGSPFLIRQVS